ncbi:ethylbenzene dehydrogenase-related protein [Magnetococcales bacterium HHB-1]
MRKTLSIALIMLLSLSNLHANNALEGQNTQTIVSTLVSSEPTIDGKKNDSVWSQAKTITTIDKITRKPVQLTSVHTTDKIFFLVQYPDQHPDTEHKILLWNPQLELYQMGLLREDSFVFKWSMARTHPIDLTLSANQPYQADIWFWKAARTNHAGYADDKIHQYDIHHSKHAKRLLSKNGHIFYLKRLGDQGTAAYKTKIYTTFDGPDKPQFDFITPGGSRADVRAKGHWLNKQWTLEFARKLNTNHHDDLQFNREKKYQFGISIYEIAGRKKNPQLSKPLFGSGEVGEQLNLIFR